MWRGVILLEHNMGSTVLMFSTNILPLSLFSKWVRHRQSYSWEDKGFGTWSEPIVMVNGEYNRQEPKMAFVIRTTIYCNC
jgi:hypothetical protein